MMHFTLPIPPSSNMAYRNVMGVGRAKTKDHKEWKRIAGVIARTQHRLQGRPRIASGTPYRMLVRINLNRRGDIMNREKLLTDLLVSLEIIPDDRWCDEFCIYRDNQVDGCEIVIQEKKGAE